MTTSTPCFSVVLPTWNDAQALGGAVDSILGQTFEDFELIVVDDGSTDDTRVRIETLADPRVRYVRQTHAGVTSARNRGLTEARGHWVTFLDSDDEARPGWLTAFAEALREDRVGMVCCGLVLHGPDGDTFKQLPESGNTLFNDHEVLFLAGTFAVRRSVLEEVGGYRSDLFFSENTELGIRLVGACMQHGLEIRSLHRALLEYHPRQLSSLDLRRQRHRHRLAAIETLLGAYPERFHRDSELHEVHLTLAGTTAVRAGWPKRSHEFFRQALRLRPRSWKHLLRWLVSYLPGVRSVVWKP